MPKLRMWSGDVLLVVGVLHGLTVALLQGKGDRAALTAAVEELFPKILQGVLYLRGAGLAMLHSLLCELSTPDKIQAIMNRVASEDAARKDFYDRTFLSGLSSIMRTMRARKISPNTVHHQQFFIARLERYLWREVEPEPSTSLHRAKAGCGKCLPCKKLDNFLVSAEKKSEFQLSFEEMKHVSRQIDMTPRHFRYYDTRPFVPELAEDGEPLRITKKIPVAAEHQRYHTEWRSKAKSAKEAISSIAPKHFLREALGANYEEITRLKGVKLVRDAEGKQIGLGTYSQYAPVEQDAAPPTRAESGDELARTETTFSEIVMPTDASLKRKVASDVGANADQENIAPPAKRSLVIDLCSDDEDD